MPSETSTIDLASPFRIGEVEIRNRVLLAPMSGVSDVPFRRMAWKHGAGMVVSEMVASEAYVTGQQEMELKAASANLPVHMVQLAGREPDWMAKAASMAEASGADIIDINMGCPSRRVTTGYSGSALMRDLDHAMTLVESVIGAVKVPVTLKMRLGWDHNSINAPELARRAEAAGIRMITVHGRTRCQFYKGRADWQAIRDVRAVTSVPLVVNGDIADAGTASAALEQSGADAVMVGRGSYGAPWLPGDLATGHPGCSSDLALAEYLDRILEHYCLILDFFEEEFAIRHARKHLAWYLERLGIAAGTDNEFETVRRSIMTSKDPCEVRSLLTGLFGELARSGQPSARQSAHQVGIAA